MTHIRERSLSANGLNFCITEAGSPDKPLVLCLHGFPECSASWRFQLPVLADAGYYAVAPDLRGYGFTGGPKAVHSYRQSVLAQDVAALIHALDHQQAILMGHDWGCALTWQVARRYPELIRAVVGLSVPYGGPAPEAPTEAMRKVFQNGFFYMLYFQKPVLPEQELEADITQSLRLIFHGISAAGMSDYVLRPDQTGFLQSMSTPKTQPAWMTENDLAHYTARFKHSGFTGPLNWYRSMDASWEESRNDSNWHIPMPTLFIAGRQDPVIAFNKKAMQRMGDYFDHLQTILLDNCGHWTQMEQAEQVNSEVLKFLQTLERR